jgi:hypothetical protein
MSVENVAVKGPFITAVPGRFGRWRIELGINMEDFRECRR